MDSANFYLKTEDQLISLQEYLEVHYLGKMSENFITHTYTHTQHTDLGPNNL